MSLRVITTTLYFSISTMIIATLLKIQHWQGALTVYVWGLLLAIVCMSAIIVEIVRSRKAYLTTKLTWGFPLVLEIAYTSGRFQHKVTGTLIIILLLAVTVMLYLKKGRKKFVSNRHDHIEFDSIDV